MNREYEERRYQVIVTDHYENDGYTTVKTIYRDSFFGAVETAHLMTYEHEQVEIFDTCAGRTVYDSTDC